MQSQSKGFGYPNENAHYPVELFRDADNFCLKIIDNEYREIHILEELAAEANNILKEIQHNVWKNNIPLSDTNCRSPDFKKSNRSNKKSGEAL